MIIELYHGNTGVLLDTINWPKNFPIPEKGDDIFYEGQFFRIDAKVFDYQTSTVRFYQSSRFED